MRDDCTTNSHYITYTVPLQKVGRTYSPIRLYGQGLRRRWWLEVLVTMLGMNEFWADSTAQLTAGLRGKQQATSSRETRSPYTLVHITTSCVIPWETFVCPVHLQLNYVHLVSHLHTHPLRPQRQWSSSADPDMRAPRIPSSNIVCWFLRTPTGSAARRIALERGGASRTSSGKCCIYPTKCRIAASRWFSAARPGRRPVSWKVASRWCSFWKARLRIWRFWPSARCPRRNARCRSPLRTSVLRPRWNTSLRSHSTRGMFRLVCRIPNYLCNVWSHWLSSRHPSGRYPRSSLMAGLPRRVLLRRWRNLRWCSDLGGKIPGPKSFLPSGFPSCWLIQCRKRREEAPRQLTKPEGNPWLSNKNDRTLERRH